MLLTDWFVMVSCCLSGDSNSCTRVGGVRRYFAVPLNAGQPGRHLQEYLDFLQHYQF